MATEASATLQLMCNILSLTVIVTCVILKVPQIVSIFRSKSGRGISFGSVMLETCGYSIMLTYHFAMQYPLSTYFEYTFLVLQDLTLVTLLLHYSGKLKVKILPWFAVYFVVSSSFAFRFVPDVILQLAIGSGLPLSVGSKLMQIYSIVSKQDPGQVSAVTWGMAFYTTMARSVTTLVQTGDITVLANFATSCLLNLTLMVLVIYYRRISKKKLH
ncbi:solute carrier family 66 member 3-like [Haliotis cracherodii]|uniref:solute carrier family 66 member 3-like n=1 Tax=Haliotis cracherodii TaxID=6455 RepID=UPI0039EAF280